MAGIAQTSGLRWRLRELMERLWVRVVAFALLGLVTALLAYMLRDQIPESLAGQIGAGAIQPILEIIASSMLTVTTFSLSILTAAYATASSGATPRAVQLLVRDHVSQTVLATFIGAFIFSLVGLIMLNTHLYGGGGRVVLFAMTLVVIVIVIVSLMRWIHRLEELGLIGDTLTRVETATDEALARRLASPWLGANPLRGDPPAESVAIPSPEVGYIQNCDMQRLSDLADKAGAMVYLTATPGDLVHPGQPLFHVSGLSADADDLRRDLTACITVRQDRSFDQDPRFGFQVMSEVGQRALSPAVNDPGTAVAVITRVLRVLSQWQHDPQPEVRFPRLYLRAVTTDEILRESLLPLARDGATMVEVQHAVQTCLLALTRLSPHTFGPGAASLSADALVYARKGLILPAHGNEIAGLSDQIIDSAGLVVPIGHSGNL